MGKQNAIMLCSPFQNTLIIGFHETDVLNTHKIKSGFFLEKRADNRSGKILIGQDRNHALSGMWAEGYLNLDSSSCLIELAADLGSLFLPLFKVFFHLISVLEEIGKGSIYVHQF